MRRTAPADNNSIGGVIVAAITPRRAHEIAPDVGATLELVDFLGTHGVNGIALFGSTGEFVHFNIDDRCQVAALAVKRSRLPLLVNVSHSTLAGALELAAGAAEAFAAGVLLMPPYYFRYSQDAIRKFYLDFVTEVPPDLPVYLYNIPMFTNEIEITTALSLLETGLFAGIKDSSGSWDYFMRLRDHATNKPYAILVGNDGMFARARACGAHGVVSGVACAVPELMVAIQNAVASGDQQRIDALDFRLGEFMEWVMRFPAPVAIKEAVRQRCIKAGAPAIDLGGRESEQMEQFRAWFGPWLNDVRKECTIVMRRESGR